MGWTEGMAVGEEPRLSPALPWTPPHTSASPSLFGDLTTGGQGQCSTKLGGGIGRWVEGAPGGRKEGTGKIRTPVGAAGDRDG